MWPHSLDTTALSHRKHLANPQLCRFAALFESVLINAGSCCSRAVFPFDLQLASCELEQDAAFFGQLPRLS